MFSSELKSFHQHPNFDKSIDLEGIPHFLLKGYFQEKDCIFKYVNKVKPGTFLIINSTGEVSEKIYWDINKKYLDARVQHLNLNEYEERLEDILKKSFSLRMVADVPVGIFLSGGIDSSLVSAIIQNSTNKQLNTFTIGFEDSKYDESAIAEQIANKLGTKHETINCSEQDFKEVIPKLPFIFDEPFGDSSSIPTYLLSEFASKSVKVALSGDGGDELFGGYSKYKFIYQYNKFLKVPKLIRSGIQDIAYLCSPGLFEKFVLLSGTKSYAQLGSKFLKLRQTIGAKDTVQMFEFASSFLSDNELNLISNIKNNQLGHPYDVPSTDKFLTSMGYWDMLSYLPSDILTKVDRASMHNALETREPFLDPEILDFSFSLPSNMKISDTGDTKFLLKRLLEKHIPFDIINRPKYGFTIPIEKWMRNHLNQEINEMLLDANFFETFQLNQKNISLECKSFFINGNKLNPHVIWFIYVLYKWYELWLKN
jgi:asparagine synthase (glutamine-hydrolysing)